MVEKYAKNRKTVYLNDQIIKELKEEAERQDRTVSWIIKRAWLESRESIRKYPSHPRD